MKNETVRRLIDFFEEAGDFTDKMPSLPAGLHPRHIRVLERIADCIRSSHSPLPSEISEVMMVTRPAITRTIRELEEMGYICRVQDVEDSRQIRLSLTDKGWELYEFTITQVNREYSEALAETFTDEQLLSAVSVLKQAIQVAEKIWNSSN